MVKNPANASMMLFCGAGGVGKTSISASMALLAACNGMDSIAFTVDPARRLANTLGLQELDDQLSEIDLPVKTKHSEGRFRAAMLNLKTAAEELTHLYSPSSELADSIISNPVFQIAVTQMSNTEEYLAWGKVYQLLTSVSMDTLFVDTAPAQSALDFFDAPRQLLNLINPNHIQMIKKPIKRFAFRHKKSGARSFSVTETLLSGVAGKKWLDDAVQLLISLAELYDDFCDRVHHLQQILHNPDKTSIFLVSLPNDSSLRETSMIASMLVKSELPLKAVIFNRVTPPLFPVNHQSGINPNIEIRPSEKQRKELRSFIDNHHRRLEYETRLMNKFMKQLPREIDSYRIPLLPLEITSLSDLKRLHPYLMDCTRFF